MRSPLSVPVYWCDCASRQRAAQPPHRAVPAECLGPTRLFAEQQVRHATAFGVVGTDDDVIESVAVYIATAGDRIAGVVVAFFAQDLLVRFGEGDGHHISQIAGEEDIDAADRTAGCVLELFGSRR
jgi:hypothetical protein